MNNIKKIASVALLTASLLTAATPALAADLSKVQVKFSENINKDCLKFDAFDPVWGCFINDFVAWPGHPDLKPEPKIYIRQGLPSALFPYVFLSGLGHYLTLSYSDQELSTVFDAFPAGNNRTYEIRKDAADSFVFWALGGKLTPAKESFFKEALMK